LGDFSFNKSDADGLGTPKKEAFATVLSGPEMYRVTLKKRKRSLERVVRVFLSFNKSDAEIEFLLSNWMSEEAVCDSSVGS
jgi:hypothetical protein